MLAAHEQSMTDGNYVYISTDLLAVDNYETRWLTGDTTTDVDNYETRWLTGDTTTDVDNYETRWLTGDTTTDVAARLAFQPLLQACSTTTTTYSFQ